MKTKITLSREEATSILADYVAQQLPPGEWGIKLSIENDPLNDTFTLTLDCKEIKTDNQ